METALSNLDTAAAAVRAADVGAVATADLGGNILRLQRVLDTLRVVQAQLLAAAEQARIFDGSGHRDMAAWLAAKGRTSVGAARKQKALSDALASSTALADAVSAGSISPDTAEALAPTLAAEHSGDANDLIAACQGATPAQARAAGTAFQEMHKPAGQTDAEREHARRQRRFLRFTDNGDGMTRIDGLLPTLDARIVSNAVNHIGGDPFADDRTAEQRRADGLVMLCDAYSKGTVTGGRERPTIIVTIDLDVFEGRHPGYGFTDSGDIVPAEVVRQMATSANVQRLLTSDSVPLDLGRAKRFATDQQYRALLVRDGGCRHPDCDIPAAWCDVDHILEWAYQNGVTDLRYLVLWCFHHHHYRHRPDVRLEGDANDLWIIQPDGTRLHAPPKGRSREAAA